MTTAEFNPQPIHVDFQQYLNCSKDELLIELCDAHESIANLAVSIAFLREEEERGVQHAKAQRRNMEGTLAAYTEKKWLVKVLLEYAE